MGVCFGVSEKTIVYKTVSSISVKNQCKTDKSIKNQNFYNNSRPKCVQSTNSKHHSEELARSKIYNLKNKNIIKSSEKTITTINDDFKPVRFLDVNKYITMIDKIDQRKKEIVDVSSM
jgi:hypothetical protein